jgi:hypothetical protein
MVEDYKIKNNAALSQALKFVFSPNQILIFSLRDDLEIDLGN